MTVRWYKYRVPVIPERLVSLAPRQRITATKEVIVSTGSLETPKLLLNSGIGDPKQLSQFGIKPLVNIPDVGKNLSIQPMLTLSYFVNSTNTFDDIIRNLTLRSELIRQWSETDGGGPTGKWTVWHSSDLHATLEELDCLQNVP